MIRRKANENIELSWDDHNPELELVTLPNGKKVRRRKDGKRVVPRGPRSEGTLDPAKARAAYSKIMRLGQMDQMARRLSPAAMKFYTLLKDELDELGGMRPGAGAGVLFQRAVVEAIQQSGGGITCERLYNLYNKAQNVDHSIAGAEIDDEDYETEEEVNGRMGWD